MCSPDAPNTGHADPFEAEKASIDPRRKRLLAGAAAIRAAARVSIDRPPTDEGRVAASMRLRDEMIECSADPSGSDLAGYLPPDILDVIAEFEKESDDKKWGESIPITHDDSTFRWFGKKRRFDTPVLDPDGKQIRGRRIGYLCAGRDEPPVVYCSDGKLRMLIKITGNSNRPHNIKHNGKKVNTEHDYNGPYAGYTFTGYCRLPALSIVMPARSRGAIYPVMYKNQQSNTLRKELGLKEDLGFRRYLDT